jgi:hypothetical protein
MIISRFSKESPVIAKCAAGLVSTMTNTGWDIACKRACGKPADTPGFCYALSGVVSSVLGCISTVGQDVGKIDRAQKAFFTFFATILGQDVREVCKIIAKW